jgi:hypothetical protein
MRHDEIPVGQFSSFQEMGWQSYESILGQFSVLLEEV